MAVTNPGAAPGAILNLRPEENKHLSLDKAYILWKWDPVENSDYVEVGVTEEGPWKNIGDVTEYRTEGRPGDLYTLYLRGHSGAGTPPVAHYGVRYANPPLTDFFAADEACPLPTGFGRPYVPPMPINPDPWDIKAALEEIKDQLQLAEDDLEQREEENRQDPSPENQQREDQARERVEVINKRKEEIEKLLADAEAVLKRRQQATSEAKAKRDAIPQPPAIREGQRAELIRDLRELRGYAENIQAFITGALPFIQDMTQVDELLNDFGDIISLCARFEEWIRNSGILGSLQEPYEKLREKLAGPIGDIGHLWNMVTVNGIDLTDGEVGEFLDRVFGGNGKIAEVFDTVSREFQRLQAVDAAVDEVMGAAQSMLGAAADLTTAACSGIDGLKNMWNAIGLCANAYPHSLTLGTFSNPFLSADKLFRLPVPQRSFDRLATWHGIIMQDVETYGKAMEDAGICGTVGTFKTNPGDGGAGFRKGLGSFGAGALETGSKMAKDGLAAVVGPHEWTVKVQGIDVVEATKLKGSVKTTPPAVAPTPETAEFFGQKVPRVPAVDAAKSLIKATEQVAKAAKTGVDAYHQARASWAYGADAVAKVGEAWNAPELEKAQKQYEAAQAEELAAQAEYDALLAELEAIRQADEAAKAVSAAQEAAEASGNTDAYDYVKGTVGSSDTSVIDSTLGIPVSPTAEQTLANWVDVMRDLSGLINTSSVYADDLAALGEAMMKLGPNATDAEIQEAVARFLESVGKTALTANLLTDSQFRNIAAAACAYYARLKKRKEQHQDDLQQDPGSVDDVNQGREEDGLTPLPTTGDELLEEAEEARNQVPGLPNSLIVQIIRNNPDLMAVLRGLTGSPTADVTAVLDRLPGAFLPKGWHADTSIKNALESPFQNLTEPIDGEDLLLKLISRTLEDLEESDKLKALSDKLAGIDEDAANGLRYKALFQGKHDGGLGSRTTWLAEGRMRTKDAPLMDDILKFLAHQPVDLIPHYEWLQHLGNIDQQVVKPNDLTVEEELLANESFLYTQDNPFSMGDAFPRLRLNADKIGGPGGLEMCCLTLVAAIAWRSAKKARLGIDATDDLLEAKKLLKYVTNKDRLESVINALIGA